MPSWMAPWGAEEPSSLLSDQLCPQQFTGKISPAHLCFPSRLSLCCFWMHSPGLLWCYLPLESLIKIQVPEEDLMIRFRGLFSTEVQLLFPTLLCSWLIVGGQSAKAGNRTRVVTSLTSVATDAQQTAICLEESSHTDICGEFLHGSSDEVVHSNPFLLFLFISFGSDTWKVHMDFLWMSLFALWYLGHYSSTVYTD